jgi:hypothetical protein
MSRSFGFEYGGDGAGGSICNKILANAAASPTSESIFTARPPGGLYFIGKL